MALHRRHWHRQAPNATHTMHIHTTQTEHTCTKHTHTHQTHTQSPVVTVLVDCLAPLTQPGQWSFPVYCFPSPSPSGGASRNMYVGIQSQSSQALDACVCINLKTEYVSANERTILITTGQATTSQLARSELLSLQHRILTHTGQRTRGGWPTGRLSVKLYEGWSPYNNHNITWVPVMSSNRIANAIVKIT